MKLIIRENYDNVFVYFVEVNECKHSNRSIGVKIAGIHPTVKTDVVDMLQVCRPQKSINMLRTRYGKNGQHDKVSLLATALQCQN